MLNSQNITTLPKNTLAEDLRKGDLIINSYLGAVCQIRDIACESNVHGQKLILAVEWLDKGQKIGGGQLPVKEMVTCAPKGNISYVMQALMGNAQNLSVSVVVLRIT